jgi:hypothetical protein
MSRLMLRSGSEEVSYGRSGDGSARRRRARSTLRAVVLVAVAVPLLAGCGLFGGRSKQCREKQGYEDARSVPPLKNADGTPVQATRNALKIPEVPPATQARGPGDPCLDEPPSFYPGRPKPGAVEKKKD